VVTDQPTLNALFEIITARRGADPEASYTARLLADGRTQIVRKFGEESVELSVAALAEGKDQVVAESADLLYHLLVLWAEQGIHPDDVWRELESRFGTSGIDEKRSRDPKEQGSEQE